MMQHVAYRFVSGWMLAALVGTWAHAAEKPAFRAGAATSNITPFVGEPVVGGFSPFPARNVHDELHARCLVLDDGTTRLGIVVCDNLSIAREVCDEAKRLAHQSTGIPTERILISATHTHSSVSARPRSLLNADPELSDYQKFLVRRISDGLTRAAKHLEPARIGWGVGREPDQVFNRRWHMKPGFGMENPFDGIDQVRMNPPGGSPYLDRPAGPTDPEVTFVSLQALDGRPIALLANYSLHYVGGVGSGDLSADYFGMFADAIQRLLAADRLDPPFVGMMSNGTSGDINNINFLHPRSRQAPYVQMHHVATAVAAEVLRQHQAVKFQDWVPLDMAQRELTLETRRPTPEQVERAKKLVAGELKPDHPRDLNYAERTLDLGQGPSHVTIVLQAIRLGELAIVSSPFETFVETGLEIKARSPFKTTFTIELANGGYGYLPTPEQHRLGGYETWLGTNRVEVQGSRKMTDQLLSMLADLKSRDATETAPKQK